MLLMTPLWCPERLAQVLSAQSGLWGPSDLSFLSVPSGLSDLSDQSSPEGLPVRGLLPVRALQQDPPDPEGLPQVRAVQQVPSGLLGQSVPLTLSGP
ncbi:hypothetical protein Elgi_17590 [Paenibacillus elgii]|nr:hypothetical protein Elgi_17590 [Paenibacillus elgii]